MNVIEIATKYIGETEKPGNMGFNDAAFERKMVAVGFVKKHAWCCYFAELCFKEAFPEKAAALDKLFSAGTVQTFRNFKKAGYVIHQMPKAGTLAIYQSYKDGKALETGHAGVCVVDGPMGKYENVEGNTNDGGGREGYIVARKKRAVNLNVVTGLKLLGFIEI